MVGADGKAHRMAPPTVQYKIEKHLWLVWDKINKRATLNSYGTPMLHFQRPALARLARAIKKIGA